MAKTKLVLVRKLSDSESLGLTKTHSAYNIYETNTGKWFIPNFTKIVNVLKQYTDFPVSIEIDSDCLLENYFMTAHSSEFNDFLNEYHHKVLFIDTYNTVNKFSIEPIKSNIIVEQYVKVSTSDGLTVFYGKTKEEAIHTLIRESAYSIAASPDDYSLVERMAKNINDGLTALGRK